MANVSAVGAPRAVSRPDTNVVNLRGFEPRAFTYPTGSGKLKLAGQVNRSVNATVSMSPPTGKFMISTADARGKPLTAERAMNKDELKGLEAGMQKYLKNQSQSTNGKYAKMMAALRFTVDNMKPLLGNWEFQKAKWNQQEPKQLKDDVLQDLTLSVPKAGSSGGSTVKAYELKSDPDQVVFEKTGARGSVYFGPVSASRTPKELSR